MVGVVMIFTPGPALVFIPLSVLLLATEFPWAERYFHRMKDLMHDARARWRLRRRRRAQAQWQITREASPEERA